MANEGIWFVYRSHYEGPLSKRVRRLAAPSILEWFRDRLRQARDADDPRKMIGEELGANVYGLGTFFEAAKRDRFALPRSMPALAEVLDHHAYNNQIVCDRNGLRVRTDDDEVELAYFFFTDDAELRHPERVTYLLHEDPRLPDGAADGGFVPPVEPTPMLPAGKSEGATYACLLTFADSESIPGEAAVFPGVRLPGLAGHLRQVTPQSKPRSPTSEYLDTWPVEMRLLRAMLDPGDTTIGPALERANSYPLTALQQEASTNRLGHAVVPAAREEFLAAGGAVQHRGDPSRSILHVGEHVAVLCVHAWDAFGYQQWILFDDLWAAAHPELASSLLWYTSGWDPFQGLTGGRGKTK